ncbi:MAG: cysteine desulfurase [Clostridia bacterium]|nr:cysteine desulfurase [Clostridia bacterium]
MKYFDNCATSPIDQQVLDLMYQTQQNDFYNPSSLYKVSNAIHAKLNNARSIIADIIGADSNEIYFTSGGTESNNLALFGSLRNKKGTIITSKVEHASVYNSINELKNRGFDVVYAPINKDGSVKTEGFEDLIDENTVMVSLMHVNNETGAINDIKTLCAKAKSKNNKCLFFCDGVQSFCKIPANVKNLGVDFYSMSAHKIHGPKGVGALYVAKNVNLNPIIFGGGQENKLRSGTENVAGIIGFGKAAEIANSLLNENSARYLEFKGILRDTISNIVQNFVEISTENGAPNVFTLAFKNIKSEVVLHMLEPKGFFVGNGSACSSKQLYSRLAMELNLSKDFAEGIIRICFSKFNTYEEVKQLGETLGNTVNTLRKIMGVK